MAVGLCRCSTDRQDRSIAEQEAAIRAWAEGRGARLLKVFKDEGVSGLDLSRPGLDACLELIAGSATKGTVVLWSRDRLVRPEDPIDGLILERDIKRTGWELCYLTGANTTGNPLVDAILGLVEHHASGEYLRKLARDSLRNLTARLRAGDAAGGKIPYGYAKAVLGPDGQVARVIPRGSKHRKLSSEQTRLVLGDPREIETVRWVFAEFASGRHSPSDLAIELERRGAPRPTNGPWFAGTVKDILLNPVFTGDLVWNRETSARCVRLLGGELSTQLAVHTSRRNGRRSGWARNAPEDHLVIPDQHPPIISREAFAAAQAAMDARREPQGPGTTRRSFPLGGLTVCGDCGQPLFSRTARAGSREYRYYECRAHSEPHLVRADLLERAVLAELRRVVRPGTGIVTEKLEALEQALAAADRIRARRIAHDLLGRVSVHSPDRSPRQSRKRCHRAWIARITLTSLFAKAASGRPKELIVE